MRTDELITVMCQNPPSCRKRHCRCVAASIIGLLLAFAVIVAVLLGFRDDLPMIMHDQLMLFKYAFLTAVMVISGFAWWQSGHPDRKCKLPLLGLAALAVLLGFTVLRALSVEPLSSVALETFDRTAWSCAGFLSTFTIVGAGLLLKLGQCMAPLNIRRHAFLTALFAASLGALAYGLHCTHDHPAYLALWYAGTTIVLGVLAIPVLKKKLSW